MSATREGLDPVRRRLKVATHRSVKQVGGLDAFSEITRVGRKTIYDYSNTGNKRHRDTFMPVDVLGDLILDVRDRGEVPPLLLVLCELAGGTFVPDPEFDLDAPAQEIELAAVCRRLFKLASLISGHLADELDAEDFAAQSRPMALALLNDITRLKHQSSEEQEGAAE